MPFKYSVAEPASGAAISEPLLLHVTAVNVVLSYEYEHVVAVSQFTDGDQLVTVSLSVGSVVVILGGGGGPPPPGASSVNESDCSV